MIQKKYVGLICLLVALLEGFAGLGIEIYAIRISSIYIGSSTAITGMILALVLIAIAFGYWFGGRLSDGVNSQNQLLNRAALVLALSTLSHALACLIQLPMLEFVTAQVSNPLISAILVGLLFGVGLAFGSTCIPLITQFLTIETQIANEAKAGKYAGLMVATTTVGSVVGSTLTPILLLPNLGLMQSLAIFITTLSISSLLCCLLAYFYQKNWRKNLLVYFIIVSSLLSTFLFITFNKVDTGYQTAISTWFITPFTNKKNPNVKAMAFSDSPTSMSSCWIAELNKSCGWYMPKMVEVIEHTDAKKILILGGAGMGIPMELASKNTDMLLTVVDIDKDVKSIVEEHFLKQALPATIDFVGEDARVYQRKNSNQKFDFIIIDAFHGLYVANNLFSYEALTGFKNMSDKVTANIIGYPSQEHGYTQTLLATWYYVFGDNAYIIVKPTKYYSRVNMILCSYHCKGGKKLYSQVFFNPNKQINTDNLPVLDKFYYKAL